MNFALPIEENCKNYPEKTCIVDGDIRVTYGEMERRASRLAHALTGMGVSPGDRVAIFPVTVFGGSAAASSRSWRETGISRWPLTAPHILW